MVLLTLVTDVLRVSKGVAWDGLFPVICLFTFISDFFPY